MPSTLNQRQALLVLNGLPHVGPVMLRRLMDAFEGDAVAVLSGQKAKLLEVKGVGQKAAGLRVSEEDELKGLDMAEHGELAFNSDLNP